eukprot:CAMPEP_0169465812 /NCGR_PEP_ID=MMETSP1042-20121227/21426_1 /TAXON_ID=464988 /ORGANISM="Hemiselmis andersenii, Strain CCMP1180" /LENGTH=85 /DNA_ID=CAMNT_0009578807 /DNA_START=239 /DNA_END=493 /DNA_ORIENTATION=-
MSLVRGEWQSSGTESFSSGGVSVPGSELSLITAMVDSPLGGRSASHSRTLSPAVGKLDVSPVGSPCVRSGRPVHLGGLAEGIPVL